MNTITKIILFSLLNLLTVTAYAEVSTITLKAICPPAKYVLKNEGTDKDFSAKTLSTGDHMVEIAWEGFGPEGKSFPDTQPIMFSYEDYRLMACKYWTMQGTGDLVGYMPENVEGYKREKCHAVKDNEKVCIYTKNTKYTQSH